MAKDNKNKIECAGYEMCRGPEIRQSQVLDQSQAPVTTVDVLGFCCKLSLE